MSVGPRQRNPVLQEKNNAIKISPWQEATPAMYAHSMAPYFLFYPRNLNPMNSQSAPSGV